MKQENEKEALFKKFIANQCSPDEIERVFQYLASREADTALHRLIAQQLQVSALSAEKMDPRLTEEMRSRILSQLQHPEGRTDPSGTSVENPDIHEESPAIWPTETPAHDQTNFERRTSWTTFKVAAVFAGIFLLAGTAYRLFLHRQLISHSTKYGEIATIFLPDSSKVILNGNSRITYESGWNSYRSREVHISGEAFFQVRHTPDDKKFTVHTAHDYSVEVLGTEFIVYDRERSSRVVLNSGKVRLKISEEGQERHIAMQPGELVEFSEGTGGYEKRKVDPRLYSSWTNKKILLHNTSFREIKQMLEETYGLPVAVHDTSLYSARFSGTVPAENAVVLLKALAISFDLTVEIKNNQVLFKPKL